MTFSPRVRRLLSGALCVAVIGLGTLSLHGESQRAQLPGGLPYIIFDDASATVSNGTNLNRTTPARKVSGQGMRGSYTALVQGQSLVWKNGTALPTGMYDVFFTAPTMPGAAEYANLSAFLVNESGKSSNVAYSVPLQQSVLQTESFEGQQWKHLGRMFVPHNGLLYSLIFSTHSASKGKDTPVDGLLLRAVGSIGEDTTMIYPGGYAERGEKTLQGEMHDGGRPLPAGTYTISASWSAVKDLTAAEKQNVQTTTPSPYVAFEAFGSVTSGGTRVFELKQALDLRKAPAGTTINGKQWQEIGTVTIPAGVQTVKLKWTVANAPGTTSAAGSVVRFPVIMHSAALHGSAESSESSSTSVSTSASTTSASSSASSDSSSESSEEEESSSSSSDASTTTSASSSSAPVLSIGSSSSSVSALPPSGDTGPIDLTPGSAVLDNTSANFFTNGFRAEVGGYRNSYHGAAPAQATQNAAGGAYAGWRMPTLQHGEYDAYLTWPSVPGGSPAVPISISTVVPSNDTYLRISKTVVVNQSKAPIGPTVADKTWQKIGRINIDEFSGHNSVEFRVTDKTPGEKVLVDALLLRKLP